MILSLYEMQKSKSKFSVEALMRWLQKHLDDLNYFVLILSQLFLMSSGSIIILAYLKTYLKWFMVKIDLMMKLSLGYFRDTNKNEMAYSKK